MPTINITTSIEETTDYLDEFAYALKLYIDETSGFTVNPGNKLFLTQQALDNNNYHYRTCLCSDLYNYPTDSPTNISSFFRQEFIYKKFYHLHQIVDFVNTIEDNLDSFAEDWEDLNTTSDSTSIQEVTANKCDLEINTKNIITGNAEHEDGSTVSYWLDTVKAYFYPQDSSSTIDSSSASDSSSSSTSDSSSGLSDGYYADVFVIDPDTNELIKLADYKDYIDFDSSSTYNKIDEITFCVNSQDRENEILDAIKNDLSNLIKELDFMDEL